VNSGTITPNWTTIESDFRAGLLSLREIAAKDGNVSEAGIRKKAKRLSWSRDLTARIRAKAGELVRSATVRSVGAQFATGSEAVETSIVQQHAEVIANVELSHRRNISRARAIVSGLFAELEKSPGDRSVELIRDPSPVPSALARDNGEANAVGALAYNGGLSLSARADAAKKLSDALRTLISIERASWGMDDREPASENTGRVIDSSKLTWDQRQQLRAMILRASDLPAITNRSGE